MRPSRIRIITAGGVTNHVATGSLSAQDAAITGTAAVIKTHDATGALLAQSASITGTSARFREFSSTGALLAQDATITGTAARTGATGAPVYSNNTSARATAASITVAHVDTVQAVTTGDLLILICGSDSGNPGTNGYVFDTPAGYTQLGSSAGNTADVATNVFYKIAEIADETATTITVTHNAGTDDLIAFHVLVTGNAAAPVYTTATTASTTAGSNSWAASVAATNVDDSLCFYANMLDGGDGEPFSVSGTGWTQQDEFNSPVTPDAQGVSGCFGTLTQATAGTPAQPTIGSNVVDGQHALYFVIEPAAAAVTHVATGALLAQDASITGTSAVIKTHVATGALTAQDSTVTGTAARFREFSSTGALIAQDAAITGTAERFREFSATGSLLAQDAAITGTAVVIKKHDATGSLTAQDASIAGTAERSGAVIDHVATGNLTAQDATVTGTAAVIKLHDATGALTAQDSTVTGTAKRFREFSSTGALTAQDASITGTAARSAVTEHVATGSLSAQDSSVSGTAAVIKLHDASGSLTAQDASITGTAARSGAAIDHVATGSLLAQDAAINGTAFNGIDKNTPLSRTIIVTSDGRIEYINNDARHVFIEADNRIELIKGAA